MIEILPETINVSIKRDDNNPHYYNTKVFVQIKINELDQYYLFLNNVTLAIKNSNGQIIVASQPETINGIQGITELVKDTNSILNLSFKFTQSIIDDLSDDIASIFLEIRSYSVEVSNDNIIKRLIKNLLEFIEL